MNVTVVGPAVPAAQNPIIRQEEIEQAFPPLALRMAEVAICKARQAICEAQRETYTDCPAKYRPEVETAAEVLYQMFHHSQRDIAEALVAMPAKFKGLMTLYRGTCFPEECRHLHGFFEALESRERAVRKRGWLPVGEFIGKKEKKQEREAAGVTSGAEVWQEDDTPGGDTFEDYTEELREIHARSVQETLEVFQAAYVNEGLTDEQFCKLLRETENTWYSLVGLRWVAESDGLGSDAFVRTLFQLDAEEECN